MAIRQTSAKAQTDSELESHDETAYLLKSPRNAERLLRALERAKAGEGEPETLDQLRQDLGIGSDE